MKIRVFDRYQPVYQTGIPVRGNRYTGSWQPVYRFLTTGIPVTGITGIFLEKIPTGISVHQAKNGIPVRDRTGTGTGIPDQPVPVCQL